VTSRIGTTCITASACLIGSFFAGCGSKEPISGTSRELPFVIRLNQVRIVGAGGSPEAAPAPGFGNAPDLTRRMAEKLREARAFTWVSLEEDKQVSPDLELQVDFIEPDFGAGEVEWVGATFSTLTWLLAGHLSWVINNRAYPNSRVVMRVDLRPAVKESDAETAKRDWYHDDLPLKGLSTNFYERADMRYWVVNILVPPWWDDGDPETAGESLIDRALEFFVENEPDRIFLALPGTYFRNRYSFLVNDTEKSEVLIISQADIEDVRIRCDSGRKRALSEDELEGLKVPDEKLDEVRRWLAGRVIGLGDLQNDTIYRIPLAEEERGYVRISAQPRALTIPRGQWTVYRPHSGRRNG